MSDEYQLRKDIDRVINDVYNLQSNELDIYKKNEIDTKFDKYYDKGQVDEMIGHGGGGDLSNYYTKTEINTILSSYVTNETLDDYALKSELFSGSYTDLTNVPSSFPPSTHTHDDRYYTESEVDTALNGKQPTLVSGTNIKTINNESLLGSGNIVIGGTGTIDDTVTRNSPNPVKSSGIWSELQKKQEDLSQSSNAYDGFGISIFFDDGSLFYGMGGRLYYDWADTEELHYYTSNSDDINFDDIIVEGDSRLSDARTPTSHSHQISDVTNLQTSLNGKANSTHSHSISDVTNLQSTLNDKLEDSDLLDLIYPIGAIYMEKDTRSHSVCPIQQTLGGTWTRIENRFLYASENGQGLGNTGGEETHTLTESEIPSHNHNNNLGMYYLKNAATASASSHVTNWSNHYDTALSNNTKNTGGGQAHNNMPPFIIVNVWERTA